MSAFTVALGAGTQALKIFNVSAGGITSFTILAPVIDNLISVATGNTATWGLGGSLTSFAGTFQNATSLTSVPDNIPATVLNLSNMFNNCQAFNQNISNWTVQNVTNMSGMFNGCIAYNNDGVALWNSGTAFTLVTNMSSMFENCTVFNVAIDAWNTTAVTNMSNMFFGCLAFNQNITNWNTSSVTSMAGMFGGAPNSLFNQNIRYWAVRTDATLTNMFTDPSAFKNAYYGTTGYNGSGGSTTTTPLYTFFNLDPLTRYPCFMKGTQILCFRGEEEVYRPIQDLRKGDLVKTYRNGYLPIHMIGTSGLSNPGDDERITNRLYKCSKELYPDLFEDLYITGCHSILVPSLTDDQWENTKAILGNVYITDNHFRLMACVDEKAQPYKRDAIIDIYHIALENDDYYMNYGVYANGLLVESCSKRYLTELSNMRIIGEDEACYDTPKVNVFSELGAFVQTF
jgi:surface protein